VISFQWAVLVYRHPEGGTTEGSQFQVGSLQLQEKQKNIREAGRKAASLFLSKFLWNP